MRLKARVTNQCQKYLSISDIGQELIVHPFATGSMDCWVEIAQGAWPKALGRFFMSDC